MQQTAVFVGWSLQDGALLAAAVRGVLMGLHLPAAAQVAVVKKTLPAVFYSVCVFLQVQTSPLQFIPFLCRDGHPDHTCLGVHVNVGKHNSFTSWLGSPGRLRPKQINQLILHGIKAKITSVKS